MGFEKFGRKSFTSATKVNKFVEFLSAGEIKGTVCKRCGRKFFPPRADCSECLSSEMEWFNLPERGKVLTYTTAFYAPFGFEMDTPYSMALVELSEGLKLFARVSKDVSPEELRTGMEVVVRPVTYEDGQVSFEIFKS
jgi:uncharacterized OB-fold protein